MLARARAPKLEGDHRAAQLQGPKQRDDLLPIEAAPRAVLALRSLRLSEILSCIPGGKETLLKALSMYPGAKHLVPERADFEAPAKAA
jgi:hypothetical protein